MAYGQHQSFYLRYRWLAKIKNYINDPRFFYDKEAFEKVGLGKNMVQSLRFWALATRILEEKNDKETRKRIFTKSKFGELFYQYDASIRLNDTAAILHYHLVKEKEPASAWFWFFNQYHGLSFSKDQLYDELLKWVGKVENKKGFF
nr:DUF4007 family protein [Thalassobacillus sp. C254]